MRRTRDDSILVSTVYVLVRVTEVALCHVCPIKQSLNETSEVIPIVKELGYPAMVQDALRLTAVRIMK
jgi:hypothetical protein